jgi:hypothetical protein
LARFEMFVAAANDISPYCASRSSHAAATAAVRSEKTNLRDAREGSR